MRQIAWNIGGRGGAARKLYLQAGLKPFPPKRVSGQKGPLGSAAGQVAKSNGQQLLGAHW